MVSTSKQQKSSKNRQSGMANSKSTIPWPKEGSPHITLTSIKPEINSNFIVEFDVNRAHGNFSKVLELPAIFSHRAPAPPKPSKDFKVLPRDIKYTSAEKFASIDDMRTKLRMNEMDHINYDPTLDSQNPTSGIML